MIADFKFFFAVKSKKLILVKNNFRYAQELMNPRPTIKKTPKKATPFFATKLMSLVQIDTKRAESVGKPTFKST